MISCTLLFISAFIAYTIGTTTAGGAAIIFLLLLTWVLPLSVIPIVIGFVGTFAGVYRSFTFRRDIYWPILKWLLPGTILGSILGASIFSLLITQSGEHFLELLLALLLILCGSMGLLNKKKSSAKKASIWLFLPGGFIIATISGVIGGAPPIINTLYQRFSITPKTIVGTKSINLFVLQLTKSLVYAAFIGMHFSDKIHGAAATANLQKLVLFSLIASVGAAIGISLGRYFLGKLNGHAFRLIINAMLILFGCYFLYLWIR